VAVAAGLAGLRWPGQRRAASGAVGEAPLRHEPAGEPGPRVGGETVRRAMPGSRLLVCPARVRRAPQTREAGAMTGTAATAGHKKPHKKKHKHGHGHKHGHYGVSANPGRSGV
jgi:hypothetical protein